MRARDLVAGFIANPAQTWFTDATLEPGHTAQYVVVAVVPSGVGPTSNQVITGKRPATTTTRANGAATSIAVDWDKVTGATGYDVFRDGVLARSRQGAGDHVWARVEPALGGAVRRAGAQLRAF